MRSISRQTAAALKATTQGAYEAVGGVLQAADLIGVGSPQLTKYASPDEKWADRFIRIDLAVDLDRRSTHPFILTTMARETGFRLVRAVEEASDLSLTPMAVLQLDSVLDDVVGELADAVADGHMSAGERRDARKKIALGQIALARMDAMLIGGDE